MSTKFNAVSRSVMIDGRVEVTLTCWLEGGDASFNDGTQLADRLKAEAHRVGAEIVGEVRTRGEDRRGALHEALTAALDTIPQEQRTAIADLYGIDIGHSLETPSQTGARNIGVTA